MQAKNTVFSCHKVDLSLMRNYGTGVKASVVFTVLLFCLYCVSTVAIVRVFFQCCRSGAGSRTAWIRIDFDLFLLGVFCLDLDPAFKSRYNTQAQIETLVLAAL
jgi:hypothetical protein